MRNDMTMNQPRQQRGQSLVEVALFLPIFIIILAGLIEVSQLVITQNRVSQAARTASRFGATGGQDEGIVIVALNSITQTLQMGEERWDMWVIRGTLNNVGDDFVPGTWEFNHVYGISNTVDFGTINEADIQTEIITDLNNNNLDASNVQIVGLYAMHDVESILGLDAIPYLTGLYTIQGFSYMRQTGTTTVVTNGCDAFPIGVSDGARSVTAVTYPSTGDFDYPSPPPLLADFFNHRADIPLHQASEGIVYKFDLGTNPGQANFGWLVWNQGITPNGGVLNNSLTWPGNSFDYTNQGDAGNASLTGTPWVVRGYVNPDDTSDQSLHVDDWVPLNTTSVNPSSQLQGHINNSRALRLVVWDQHRSGGGDAYQITGFAVFKLQGYHLSPNGQGGSWLLAEFVRWDRSCGQQAATP